MKKINDNFYFNSNSISALYLANAVVTVILADGGEVTIDDDTFNAIAEDISSFKVNDNLYINPAQIVAMTFFDGEYHIVLVNDIRLELSEDEITNLVGNDYIKKINHNLYINPNHIVGLASANGNRIITMVDNIRFEVSEEEYIIVSEIEPITSTGGNVVLPYGQTNPDLYYGQFIADNTVIEVDLVKLGDYIKNNSSLLDTYSTFPEGSDTKTGLILLTTNNTSLNVRINQYSISFEASGYDLASIQRGDYNSPLDLLIDTATLIINKASVVELGGETAFAKINKSYITSAPGLLLDDDIVTNTNDFIKIYNV